MDLKNSNQNQWVPIKGDLLTRWVEDVDPSCPLPEYPRPQMRREKWKNLNGLWDYAITDNTWIKDQVDQWEGQILVPYPVESALSGVKRTLLPNQQIFYHRTFSLPKQWETNLTKHRILLHFGGVDWKTTVWINNHQACEHFGGDTPFSIDITDYLTENQDESHELLMAVWDPTDKGRQERGKQKLKPHTIFYNAMSGIWQTVWMECVSDPYIQYILPESDIDQNEISVKIDLSRQDPSQKEIFLRMGIKDKGSLITEKTIPLTKNICIITETLKNPKLWSPESPFLYDLELSIVQDETEIDHVKSYFGMRKIAVKLDDHGIPRIELNNRVLFQYGLLDQGWWPDGLYTAPTDQALKWDLEITKSMGFNMVRKHVKVEPARWYYHCDKLGLLVWQDMPSGGVYGNWIWVFQMLIGFIFKKAVWAGRKSKEDRNLFYTELNRMVRVLAHFPSVVTWVPFNEGWGQFQTREVTSFLRTIDSTRLIDSASGWVDYQTGDIFSIHRYPGPAIGNPKSKDKRALGLSEFGGLGFTVKGHIWQTKQKKWGYKNIDSPQDLKAQYRQLIEKLQKLIPRGLNAAIYTQTTDVEQEVNGLITYDRDHIKLDPAWLHALHQSLYSSKEANF
ncbi:MAG: glycoside hydrolase family 2 protein [Promethearchaeota archaeon]